ncbi:MAG: TylF/MycF/NovP-related O-methyltransferase [Actinomycetota bacterium]
MSELPEVAQAGSGLDTAEERYLDLMKRVLTRTGFVSYQLPIPRGWRRLIYKPIRDLLNHWGGLQLVRQVDAEHRHIGGDWPADAETMVGMVRLNNLQECVTDVITRKVPGDLIETGVWRGGASIFMAAVLKAYGETDRTLWVADSFRGLPEPEEGTHAGDVADPLVKFHDLAVPLDVVQNNFRKYGLLSEQVRFLVGWFQDTLPSAEVDQLAVLRLDGDMYDSTMVALESLYPKLSVGGYVIVDDYSALAACKDAVDEFRAREGIDDPMITVDWAAVYWQRTA